LLPPYIYVNDSETISIQKWLLYPLLHFFLQVSNISFIQMTSNQYANPHETIDNMSIIKGYITILNI